ncbi:hypothetical protein [Acanthopleuribacter pedis]|uniref:Uncharacterized protein n=1 Tax=Acanthopleuribacter pedis TaxID=442870 RepID=A0A8J7U280_9BACT|nr:hypothetical protein [Acanthopleuribacter pedis]MBO1316993.1 hypothetical protein [Acanthopleuribacter pedis]
MRAKAPIALNLDDVWEVFLDHLRRQMEAQNPILKTESDYKPEPEPSYIDSGAHHVVKNPTLDQG